MLEFFRIVQNEWIKLFRRRRFLVVLLLGLALVSVFTYSEYHDSNAQKMYADPAYQIQMTKDNIGRIETDLKNNPQYPAELKASFEQEIKNQKEHLAKLNETKWTEPVFDNQDLKKQIDQSHHQIDTLPAHQKWQSGNLQLQIKILEYKMAHQIPNPQDEMPHFITSGWHGIRDFLNIGPAVFIPLLSVLLVSDIVSGEQTGGTIKLLLIRPASRGKILLAKYVTSVVANLLVNVVMFVLLAGAMLLVMGTKNWNDPIAVNVKSYMQTLVEGGSMQQMMIIDPSHATIISMQSFALTGMLLTLLASIAMCTLGFFCSVLVRSAAVSTGLAMGIVIIGTILLGIGHSLSWKKYLITSDFNLPQAWLGQLNGLGGNATLSESLVILLVWSVTMYVISHMLFRRRDILG